MELRQRTGHRIERQVQETGTGKQKECENVVLRNSKSEYGQCPQQTENEGRPCFRRQHVTGFEDDARHQRAHGVGGQQHAVIKPFASIAEIAGEFRHLRFMRIADEKRG
ncbi:MAG: hypothetical protein CMM63_09405 [Rhodospirillaceae bacterium]|nr:hypothetical protein [Rhodospirillaceae bacterium]